MKRVSKINISLCLKHIRVCCRVKFSSSEMSRFEYLYNSHIGWVCTSCKHVHGREIRNHSSCPVYEGFVSKTKIINTFLIYSIILCSLENDLTMNCMQANLKPITFASHLERERERKIYKSHIISQTLKAGFNSYLFLLFNHNWLLYIRMLTFSQRNVWLILLPLKINVSMSWK